MSGVGFLAAVKTFTPSARRRRRSEKQLQRLELPGTESSTGQQAPQPDVVPIWDTAPPITPPAAFLPPNHKKNKASAAIVVAAGEPRRSWRSFSGISSVLQWILPLGIVVVHICLLCCLIKRRCQ